jgi:rSAM/selenodomain-associated transferase 1
MQDRQEVAIREGGARRALLLFAKDPARSEVKTRLRAVLSAADAERLYRAFVLDLVDRFGARSVRERLDLALFVHLWPPPEEAGADIWPGGDARVLPQTGGDLGERLHAALSHHLARGREEAVVIGSDHPTLPVERVEEAFAALASHDAVLGPARDGGYYLVGLRRPAMVLFEDMPWSTDRLLAATRRRARDAGLALAELVEEGDVDTPEDLASLRERRRIERADARRSSGLGARTARVLDEWER